MGRHWRWIVVVLALPLLALTGYTAVRMGQADALATHVARQLVAWQQRRPPQTLSQWIAARAQLDRAAGLEPGSPSIPELGAQLYLQGGARPEFALLALDGIQRSIVLRPSSPYAWASLAEARARLQFPPNDIHAALMTAWRQGPSEPEVQRVMVDLGLALWDSVPEVRAPAGVAIANAMRRNPYRTLPIVFRRGRLELACPFVANDPRLARTVWPRRCKLDG